MSIRITQHRGRVGKATTTADHLDRQGKVKELQKKDPEKVKHIDQDRSKYNKYYAYGIGQWTGNHYQGKTIREAEIKYYEDFLGGQIERVNQAAIKRRHLEDMTSAEKLYEAPKTRPEEIITQIGRIDDLGTETSLKRLTEDIEAIEIEYLQWHQKKYPQIALLSYAIHLDEKIPHLHERRTYLYHKDGHWEIGQERALEEMGVELPNPNQPRSRYNNRKITYTKECREKLMEIVKEYGYQVIEQPQERSKTRIDKETAEAEKKLQKALAKMEAREEFEQIWKEAEEEIERGRKPRQKER